MTTRKAAKTKKAASDEPVNDAHPEMLARLTKDRPEASPALAQLFKELQEKHLLYVALLDSGHLGNTGFANGVNSSMTEMVRKVADLVGPELVEEVYNVKPGEFVYLVNPDMMADEGNSIPGQEEN